ncbi:MAG: hypothetical protein G01um10147_227 [Microgenomates group bacterium Gr01-1014_7]|nr:MAG: hypothetical protein G01um10147_227 [Microgenomates group bacterium Gr01-1014_7]
MSERPFSVLLTDLDGVVFWRIPAQKAGLTLNGTNCLEHYLQPVNDLSFNGRIDDLLSPETVLKALRHLLVPVFPDVKNVLRELHENRIKIMGNTGRYNDCAMVSATNVSLALNGVSDCFQDILFRPYGFTTAESKDAGFRYATLHVAPEQEIIAVDDNPLDLLPLARKHPNGRFVLIRDLTTDRLLRGVNLEEDFPNVQVHPTLRAALLESF